MSKKPVVVRVLGIDPRTSEGRQFLSQHEGNIRRYHHAQAQNFQLSGLEYVKHRTQLDDDLTAEYNNMYGQEYLTLHVKTHPRKSEPTSKEPTKNKLTTELPDNACLLVMYGSSSIKALSLKSLAAGKVKVLYEAVLVESNWSTVDRYELSPTPSILHVNNDLTCRIAQYDFGMEHAGSLLLAPFKFVDNVVTPTTNYVLTAMSTHTNGRELWEKHKDDFIDEIEYPVIFADGDTVLTYVETGTPINATAPTINISGTRIYTSHDVYDAVYDENQPEASRLSFSLVANLAANFDYYGTAVYPFAISTAGDYYFPAPFNDTHAKITPERVVLSGEFNADGVQPPEEYDNIGDYESFCLVWPFGESAYLDPDSKLDSTYTSGTAYVTVTGETPLYANHPGPFGGGARVGINESSYSAGISGAAQSGSYTIPVVNTEFALNNTGPHTDVTLNFSGAAPYHVYHTGKFNLTGTVNYKVWSSKYSAINGVDSIAIEDVAPILSTFSDIQDGVATAWFWRAWYDEAYPGATDITIDSDSGGYTAQTRNLSYVTSVPALSALFTYEADTTKRINASSSTTSMTLSVANSTYVGEHSGHFGHTLTPFPPAVDGYTHVGYRVMEVYDTTLANVTKLAQNTPGTDALTTTIKTYPRTMEIYTPYDVYTQNVPTLNSMTPTYVPGRGVADMYIPQSFIPWLHLSNGAICIQAYAILNYNNGFTGGGTDYIYVNGTDMAPLIGEEIGDTSDIRYMMITTVEFAKALK